MNYGKFLTYLENDRVLDLHRVYGLKRKDDEKGRSYGNRDKTGSHRMTPPYEKEGGKGWVEAATIF